MIDNEKNDFLAVVNKTADRAIGITLRRSFLTSPWEPVS